MRNQSSVSRFDQVVRGRNLILLAVADVVLFLVANVAYGAGHQHGLRNNVSNVAWVLFLVGFLVLIVLGIVALAQLVRRHGRAQAVTRNEVVTRNEKETTPSVRFSPMSGDARTDRAARPGHFGVRVNPSTRVVTRRAAKRCRSASG